MIFIQIKLLYFIFYTQKVKDKLRKQIIEECEVMFESHV